MTRATLELGMLPLGAATKAPRLTLADLAVVESLPPDVRAAVDRYAAAGGPDYALAQDDATLDEDDVDEIASELEDAASAIENALRTIHRAERRSRHAR